MAHQRDADAFDDLRSYASELVTSATPLDPASLHLLDGAPVPSRPHHLTAPMMAVMGVAAMLLFAEVGVAVVANDAVPGDRLYGIDLLLEDAMSAVGVPVNVAGERLDEAETLLERNEVDEAIRTARVGYTQMEPPVLRATVAPLVKAELILAESPDPAVEQQVRDGLAELLDATKDAAAIEAGDVRKITDAVARIADLEASSKAAAP